MQASRHVSVFRIVDRPPVFQRGFWSVGLLVLWRFGIGQENRGRSPPHLAGLQSDPPPATAIHFNLSASSSGVYSAGLSINAAYSMVQRASVPPSTSHSRDKSRTRSGPGAITPKWGSSRAAAPRFLPAPGFSFRYVRSIASLAASMFALTPPRLPSPSAAAA